MLITLLNDGTLITIAYDHAEARDTPCIWNLPALFVTSTTLGVVSCFSSLLLLHILLDSWNEDGFFQKIGFRGVEYGQMILAMYLKISVSDFLTLFSARTGTRFFYEVAPGPMLLAGGAFALFISSLLSIVWKEGEIEEIPVNGLVNDMELFGFVWIYSLLFFFLQDILKVGVFKWMYWQNFHNIASTGVVVLPKSAEQLIKDMEAALGESGNKHH
jgi:H+-transporting ATPase